MSTRAPLLVVENLSVTYGPAGPAAERGAGPPPGAVHAVRGVSFAVRPGQVLGVVGESGSGKTTLALALLRLLPRGARATGAVRLGDTDLLELDERSLADVRGRRIGIVFQDPGSALSPVYRVGDQLAEAIRAHHRVSRREARDSAVRLLEHVGVASAALRARSYPHELSGGLRQRVTIAMAMASRPQVLVADEPTAALDPTVRAQVLDTLAAARAQTGAALVLITHDLTMVAGHAERVMVMYAGRVVESAGVDDLFERACMPYTLGLLGAAPRLDAAGRLDAGRQPVTILGGEAAAAPPPAGCAFAPRCPLATGRCRVETPPLRLIGRRRHLVACHHAERLSPPPPTRTGR